MIQTDVVFAGLDVVRSVVEHESLGGMVNPPKFLTVATNIREIVIKEGYELVGRILHGLAGDFPEDAVSIVITIMRSISASWPTEILSWLPPILQQLPTTTMPADAKARFLQDVNGWVCLQSDVNIYIYWLDHRAITSAQYDKVKQAVLALNRASRKTRERRRAEIQTQ